jgi:hypothetical protein
MPHPADPRESGDPGFFRSCITNGKVFDACLWTQRPSRSDFFHIGNNLFRGLAFVRKSGRTI